MPALCRSMALERVVNIRQGNGEASANHAKQSRRIPSHDWISGGRLLICSFFFLAENFKADEEYGDSAKFRESLKFVAELYKGEDLIEKAGKILGKVTGNCNFLRPGVSRRVAGNTEMEPILSSRHIERRRAFNCGVTLCHVLCVVARDRQQTAFVFLEIPRFLAKLLTAPWCVGCAVRTNAIPGRDDQGARGLFRS